MSEWRTMDSAPKGGGADLVTDPNWVNPPKILLLFEEGNRSVGYWDWYYAEGGRGCTDGVAWIEPVSGEQLNSHYGNPIGWMPLPAPPLPDKEAQERRDGMSKTDANRSSKAEMITRTLGMYGQAYDPAGPQRAYTYEHQPNNVAAWRLGEVASMKFEGGDYIDCGLKLLKALQEKGFGVFEIELPEPPQPDKEG